MIAPLLVLATMSGTLDLSDKTQLNLRTTFAQNQPLSLDASTVPAAAFVASDRRLTLRAGASLSLMLLDVTSSLSPLYFASGLVDVAWRTRRATIALDQSGSYGRQNTTYLAAPPAAPATNQGPLQLVPAAIDIQYGSYTGSLVGSVQPDNRWRLVLGVGLTALGGLDEQSRLASPFLWGPNGQAGIYDSIDRHDTIFTLATGSHLKSDPTTCSLVGTPPGATSPQATTTTPPPGLGPCEPDSTIGEADLGWTHDFSLLSRGTVSAGIAAARAREQQTDPYDTRAFPAALVSYEYGLRAVGHPTVARVEGRLGPTIDYRTGFADYRGQGTVSVAWTSPRLILSGSFGVARSIESIIAPASTMIISNAEADYHLTRLAVLTTAIGGFWQAQDRAPNTASAVFSVALTVHAPLARF